MRHEALAEQVLPDAIDRDAGGERIVAGCVSHCGQFEPAALDLVDRRRRRVTVATVRKPRGTLSPRSCRVAADADAAVGRAAARGRPWPGAPSLSV